MRMDKSRGQDYNEVDDSRLREVRESVQQQVTILIVICVQLQLCLQFVDIVFF